MTADAEARAASGATRGSAIKLTAELLGRGMSLFTFLLIARGLGVTDWGTFNWWSIWAVVLAEVGELGLQGLAAQALVTGELTVRSVFRAKVVASGAGAVLALFALTFSIPLGALILFYLVAGWSELGGVTLRARGRPLAEALIILILRASGVFFVWGWLEMRPPSVEGIAWAHVISALPAAVVVAWLLRKELLFSSEAYVPASAVLRRSAPLAVNGGLALISLRVEFLVLKVLRGATEGGIFGIGLRVIEFLSMVPAAVAGGAMPGLAREASSTSDAVRRRSVWGVGLLAGAASMGLLVVAPEVVALLGAEAYGVAVTSLRILALAIPPLFGNVLLSHGLIAAGRPERLPRLTALRVGLSLGLALVLTPHFGSVGAAAGFLASECAVVFVAVRACREVRYPMPILFPFGAAILLSLPMAGVVASTTAGSVAMMVADLVVRSAKAFVLTASTTTGDDAVTILALIARIAVGVVVWVGTLGLVWSLRSRRKGQSARPPRSGLR